MPREKLQKIDICSFSKIEDLPSNIMKRYGNRLKNSENGIEFKCTKDDTWYNVSRYCKDLTQSNLGIIQSRINIDTVLTRVDIKNFCKIEELPPDVLEHYKDRLKNDEKDGIQFFCSVCKTYKNVENFSTSKNGDLIESLNINYKCMECSRSYLKKYREEHKNERLEYLKINENKIKEQQKKKNKEYWSKNKEIESEKSRNRRIELRDKIYKDIKKMLPDFNEGFEISDRLFFTYIFVYNEYIKIGYSNNLVYRESKIRNKIGTPLKIYSYCSNISSDCRNMEKFLHSAYSEYRIILNEVFGGHTEFFKKDITNDVLSFLKNGFSSNFIEYK